MLVWLKQIIDRVNNLHEHLVPRFDQYLHCYLNIFYMITHSYENICFLIKPPG